LASSGIHRDKGVRSECCGEGRGNSYVERASRVGVYLELNNVDFYFPAGL